MEDITKNLSCGNIPGFKKIEIVPVSEVKSMRRVQYNKYDIELVTGGRFAKIEANNILLNSKTEQSSNITITCTFVSTREGLDAMFDDMTRNRYIVKLTDNNNKLWGAGMPEEPLRFSFSHIGDAATSGKHAYTLNFLRSSKKPIYFIAESQ